MPTEGSFDIRTTVKGPVIKVPFEKLARGILGEDFSLSLVICGPTLAKRINREYRQKTYNPNVLSFPLSTHEGEIFLNIRKAEQEARKYGVSVYERTAFLFIHGLYHLAGLQHGATMERAEQEALRDYGIIKK